MERSEDTGLVYHLPVVRPKQSLLSLLKKYIPYCTLHRAMTTKNVMKQFFLILRAINAIEILKNRVLFASFTTPRRGKEEFLIIK